MARGSDPRSEDDDRRRAQGSGGWLGSIPGRDGPSAEDTEANAVYLVEVKSRLREEGIEQIVKTLDSFFDFFPEHRGKELYGILAAVDAPENLRTRAHRKGLYLARISGDIFELQVPDDFKPHSFSPADG